MESKTAAGDHNGDREPIIVAKNIHKTYLLGLEGVPALRGVTVTIERGEFICILGKSGGGKTSMLNIFGTIDKPTKGDLRICGQVIKESTSDEEFASLRLNDIGFVFQTFNLVSSMTAIENVMLPMILHGGRTSKEMRARASKLLEKVGLGDRMDHQPSQLSGGEQQRVTICRAVVNHPRILLLDEPTGDLDSVNSDIIMDLLLQLNQEDKITLIMVTHDRELSAFSDRTIHMVDGKISHIEPIFNAVSEKAAADLQARVKLLLDPTSSSPDDLQAPDSHVQTETELRGLEFYRTRVATKPLALPTPEAQVQVQVK
jgi:putative ABC transport system ATP-binding protein